MLVPTDLVSTGLIATLLVGTASPDVSTPVTVRQAKLFSQNNSHCLPEQSFLEGGFDSKSSSMQATAQFSCPEQLLASTSFTDLFRQYPFHFNPPPPPPRRGAPRGRRGAGSRGDCQADPSAKTITALMPSDVFGVTTEASPTLWFHVPYPAEAFHSAAFVLRNSEQQTVYRTKELSSTKLLSAGSEWVGLSLPNNMDPLEVAPSTKAGPSYRWRFVIYCQDPNVDASASVYVSGSIQRTERPDALQTTSKTHPLNQAALAAKEGLWFDTLKHLAEVECNQPSPEEKATLNLTWQTLLNDPNVNLPDVLGNTAPPGCAIQLEL